jgi:hypothetical protein
MVVSTVDPVPAAQVHSQCRVNLLQCIRHIIAYVTNNRMLCDTHALCKTRVWKIVIYSMG